MLQFMLRLKKNGASRYMPGQQAAVMIIPSTPTVFSSSIAGLILLTKVVTLGPWQLHRSRDISQTGKSKDLMVL